MNTTVLARFRDGRASIERRVDWVRRRLADPSSLLRRATVSLGWIAADQGLRLSVRLGSNLLLTRLLAPEAFGTMAAIFTFHTALELATDIGLKPAVTRSRFGAAPSFLRTAWTLWLGIHILIALCLVGIAVGLAFLQQNADLGDTVYADPAFPGLFALSALMPIARGLTSATVWLNVRQLRMYYTTRATLGGYIIGVMTMLLLVYVAPSTWSFMIGVIATAAFPTLLTHLYIPGPRMRLRLHTRFVGEIWSFGRWLLASSIFQFMAIQGDRLVLSVLLDSRTFGLYAIARVWIEALRTLMLMTRRVIRPAIAEMTRKDMARVRRLFHRLVAFQTGVHVAAVSTVVVAAPTVYGALYTSEYAGVGYLMQGLALSLLWYPYTVGNALLLARGDSKSLALQSAIEGIAIVTLTPLLHATLGLNGVLLAVALAPGVRWIVLLQRLPAHTSIPIAIYGPALAGVAVAIAVTVLSSDFAGVVEAR